jgi:hypothetical protein
MAADARRGSPQSFNVCFFVNIFYFSLEEEGVKRSGEGMGEIILLKNEIEVSNPIYLSFILFYSVAFYLHLSLPLTSKQSKNQQILALSAEKAECLTRQQQLENERLSLEAQRDDLKLHIEGSLTLFYIDLLGLTSIHFLSVCFAAWVDVMMSITTKDETISKMSRSTDDKERTLRSQLTDLQAKSKHRIGDLTSQVEQLQAEVSRRMLEAEGLTVSLSALTKTNNENKVL